MKTRKSTLALVVLLVLVFMQGQAGAWFKTGNGLVASMREYDKRNTGEKFSPADVGIYMGYVTGVADALDGILWKGPDGSNVDQICSVVSKYLKNHPERWNESAAVLVVDALKEAFPLSKKTK